MLVPSHCCPMNPMFERSLSHNKNHLLIVNLSACFLKLKIYLTVNQHFCSCWADMIPAEASKLYVIPGDFITGKLIISLHFSKYWKFKNPFPPSDPLLFLQGDLEVTDWKSLFCMLSKRGWQEWIVLFWIR